MRVEIDDEKKLNINGLQIQITEQQSRQIYDKLFRLFIQAYAFELKINELTKEAIKEAESILEQGEGE